MSYVDGCQKNITRPGLDSVRRNTPGLRIIRQDYTFSFAITLRQKLAVVEVGIKLQSA